MKRDRFHYKVQKNWIQNRGVKNTSLGHQDIEIEWLYENNQLLNIHSVNFFFWIWTVDSELTWDRCQQLSIKNWTQWFSTQILSRWRSKLLVLMFCDFFHISIQFGIFLLNELHHSPLNLCKHREELEIFADPIWTNLSATLIDIDKVFC